MKEWIILKGGIGVSIETAWGILLLEALVFIHQIFSQHLVLKEQNRVLEDHTSYISKGWRRGGGEGEILKYKFNICCLQKRYWLKMWNEACVGGTMVCVSLGHARQREPQKAKLQGPLHVFLCHPCPGAMLTSLSFQHHPSVCADEMDMSITLCKCSVLHFTFCSSVHPEFLSWSLCRFFAVVWFGSSPCVRNILYCPLTGLPLLSRWRSAGSDCFWVLHSLPWSSCPFFCQLSWWRQLYRTSLTVRFSHYHRRHHYHY